MPQTRRERLRRARSTRSIGDFKYMVRHFQGRANIVSEGDSWFDYPRRFIVGGKPANIMDHVQRWAHGSANLLRLSSSGDEAVHMLADDQRHKLTKLLHDCASTSTLAPVDLLLFSGGGNDVAGAWDLPRFVKRGNAPDTCIEWGRLRRKMSQIELALEELVDICREYSPTTVVVTHTYDRIFPSHQGAEFFGVTWTRSWVKPYLEDAGIDEALHKDVADRLLETVRDSLLRLPTLQRLQGRLFVADTMGTLTHPDDWLNEIHPKSRGFEKIARKFYAELRRRDARLPAAPP